MFGRALNRGIVWISLGLLMSVLAACSGPALSDQDRIATRVAEDRAVAATLTMEARQVEPLATEMGQATPAGTLTSTPRNIATIQPAPSSSALPANLTSTPTLEVVPIVSPSPTPAAEPTAVAIVPGFGNSNGLTGQIVLPGYTGPLDTPVFHDRIVFRLMVFDPAAGSVAGAGITSVDISINDPNGTTVHQLTVSDGGYCAFGGGPDCDVWTFVEHGNQWPTGARVCNGSGYQAGMTVHTDDPGRDGAFWGFNFSLDGNFPPCQ